MTEDHTPNHCSAPYAWNRSTSVNPSFAATRIARSFAVWVQSTTGWQGSASANQPSAAAHASAAYPCPHRSWQEQVAELGLLGVRTDRTRTVRLAPIERDHADHRAVERNLAAGWAGLRRIGGSVGASSVQ